MTVVIKQQFVVTTIFTAIYSAGFVVDSCYLNGTTFFILFLPFSILYDFYLQFALEVASCNMAFAIHRIRFYNKLLYF